MTPHEATEVLKMVARFDKRTIAGDDIKLWTAVLSQHGISMPQAIRATETHYTARPDDWIKPGHIVQIVTRERSTGLAHSARLEQAALALIDPDDPEYTSKALEAIRAARKAAADGADIPARPALPSGFEPVPERAERARRGAELARAALAEHQTGKPQHAQIDDSPRERARRRAAETGDGFHKTDMTTLGSIARRLKLRKSTGETNE